MKGLLTGGFFFTFRTPIRTISDYFTLVIYEPVFHNMKKSLLLTFCIFINYLLQAQLLADTESKQLIINGLDKLYNYEFKEADVFFQKVKTKYPKHPVTPLLTALQIEWQNLPIDQNPKALALYTQSLEKCRVAAEPMLEDDKLKPEATFFLLAAHGYTALSHHYQKENMKAGKEALKAYDYLKDGFKFMDKNPEFYFTTGLYNFYRVQYPETHPIVKPIMVFFGPGNKKAGLVQLETAIHKSLFSRVEAAYYFMGVNFKYENNLAKATQYSSWLHEKYPNNPIYSMRYVEAMVSNNKYDEVATLIQNLRKNPSVIYQISMNTFDGIAAEKIKKNDKLALHYYQNALKYKPEYEYTNDYYAMACCGIARIALKGGDVKKAKEYYKKALEYAEYKSVIAEAKKFES